MSETTHLSFRVSEGLNDAIEELAHEYRTSKSEVARNLLTTGLEQEPEDVIPEHDLIAYKRDEIKRENRVKDWRGGFETRVKQEFTRRFKNGYKPEDLAAFADGYRQEAHLLWPEDDERRNDALAYIDAMLEEARKAMETSEYEPLDPETAFSSFSGVEDGTARESVDDDVFQAIVQDARSRLSDPTKSVKADDPGFVKALSKAHSVPEQVAQDAVDVARGGDR